MRRGGEEVEGCGRSAWSVGERVREGMWVAMGGGRGGNQLATSVCRTRVSLYTSHVSCCLTQQCQPDKPTFSITLSFLLRASDFISMSQFVSDFIKYLDVLRNSVCPTSLAAGFVPPQMFFMLFPFESLLATIPLFVCISCFRFASNLSIWF